MTSIRLRFRPSSVSGKEGTLYYQVNHFRRTGVMGTSYRIYPNEWDEEHACIVISGSVCCDSERKAVLQLYQSKINMDMDVMREIVNERENTIRHYTLEDLLDVLRKRTNSMSVFRYIRSQIDKKNRMGCYGTAKTYNNVLRCFTKFREEKDIAFDGMDNELIQEYEAWMLHAGLRRSSAACYLRTLRTLYRQAVDDGQAENNDIFRKVHVSVGKTCKRAVPIETIRMIQSLDLSGKTSLDFARDIFMFSFYTRGMSFIDIAYLRKSDLRNGYLTYNRRKTFQSLVIQWEQPMQNIVDRYAGQTYDSPYFFPIVRGETLADRLSYEQALQRINRSLKRIGTLIGLPIPLSTYVARHSWASIARNMDVPLSIISEGLGHDSDKTTQIYLASLDKSMVNKANKEIISKITLI